MLKWKEIKDVNRELINGNEVVVLGCPEDDDEAHYCDVMGCTNSECVLFRGWLRSKEIGVTLKELK